MTSIFIPPVLLWSCPYFSNPTINTIKFNIIIIFRGYIVSITHVQLWSIDDYTTCFFVFWSYFSISYLLSACLKFWIFFGMTSTKWVSPELSEYLITSDCLSINLFSLISIIESILIRWSISNVLAKAENGNIGVTHNSLSVTTRRRQFCAPPSFEYQFLWERPDAVFSSYTTLLGSSANTPFFLRLHSSQLNHAIH